MEGPLIFFSISFYFSTNSLSSPCMALFSLRSPFASKLFCILLSLFSLYVGREVLFDSANLSCSSKFFLCHPCYSFFISYCHSCLHFFCHPCYSFFIQCCSSCCGRHGHLCCLVSLRTSHRWHVWITLKEKKQILQTASLFGMWPTGTTVIPLVFEVLGYWSHRWQRKRATLGDPAEPPMLKVSM